MAKYTHHIEKIWNLQELELIGIYLYQIINALRYYLGFTPCKPEELQRSMELFSHENTEVEPVLSVQMNIYQSLNLATFLRLPKLSREAASAGPTVQHIRFCNLSSTSKY